MQTVYFYVHKDVLPSVLQHGYLSVAQMRETFGALPDDIYQKYTNQIDAAVEKYPELKERLAIAPDGDTEVIAYLDWRVEDVVAPDQRGSAALYVLYFPIPNEPDIIRFVRLRRHFASFDYVLCSTRTRGRLFPIGGEISQAQATDRDFWVRTWRHQMMLDVPNPLWFDGIPHAFFIPASGKLLPEHIHVEPFLFL